MWHKTRNYFFIDLVVTVNLRNMILKSVEFTLADESDNEPKDSRNYLKDVNTQPIVNQQNASMHHGIENLLLLLPQEHMKVGIDLTPRRSI